MAGAVARRARTEFVPPDVATEAAVRPKRYSRRRAAVLAGVYVLFGLHIAHWRLSGRTLAPLELNEVMYTLEAGIVTVGFLFMAATAVSTAVFGRFFCSWGCHILALEDLSAWLLRKVGIVPRPVRSRVLLFVPPVALFYMFLWPPLYHLIRHGSLAPPRVASDAGGWASFVTSDFWRNLPGPGISALTLVSVGFVIVYALGTRSFCTYVCPYGSVFRALDRIAPGRIVARGDCSDCAHCTAVCQSHVRVHQELVAFGTVVDPRCMKDLDCVAACTHGKVRFGFTRPPLFRSLKALRGLPRQYDFSPAEDAGMVAVFLVVFFATRGLYDAIPFLLALGFGALAAYVAVLARRVLRRADVGFHKRPLKAQGRVTGAGAAFLSFSAAVTVLLAHGGFIRVHEMLGERQFASIEGGLEVAGASPSREALDSAWSHLDTVRRFGLWTSPRLQFRLARLSELRGRPDEAERGLRRLLARQSGDLGARLALGRALALQGRLDEARESLRAAIAAVPENERDQADSIRFTAAAHELFGSIDLSRGDPAAAKADFEAALAVDPTSVAAHTGLGELLAEQGELETARGHLERAVELRPRAATGHYQLGVVLAALGREDGAVASFERALSLAPDDADAHNNLGFLRAKSGRADLAEPHLRRAVELAPGHAAARFNLGRLLLERGERGEALEHLRAAKAGDARYAAAVDEILAAPGGGR